MLLEIILYKQTNKKRKADQRMVLDGGDARPKDSDKRSVRYDNTQKGTITMPVNNIEDHTLDLAIFVQNQWPPL